MTTSETLTNDNVVMNANLIYIDLASLLPDVADIRDACVQRLIGSFSAREGFEHVFAEGSAPGETATLCIRYDPQVPCPLPHPKGGRGDKQQPPALHLPPQERVKAGCMLVIR